MKSSKKTTTVDEILKKKATVTLDLACGASKHPNSIGMDVLPYPGVDIVHNAMLFPWPLPDESVNMILASHFLEHVPGFGMDPHLSKLVDLLIEKKVLKKEDIFKVMGRHHVFSFWVELLNEAWRVLKPGGQMAIAVPYYSSRGFAQDPTHVKEISEANLLYFDPEHPSGLWRFYRPKPWKIEMQTFDMNGSLEAIISKRDIKPYEAAIKAHTV